MFLGSPHLSSIPELMVGQTPILPYPALYPLIYPLIYFCFTYQSIDDPP